MIPWIDGSEVDMLSCLSNRLLLFMTPFLVLSLFSCSVLAPAGEGPRYTKGTLTVDRVVRFEHRLVNSSAERADMEIFIAVPLENERQRIRFFQADPTFVEEMADEYGNRILHYIDRDVPPGDVVAHGWIAEVELSSYTLDRDGGSGRDLSSRDREIFLRDGENYGLTTETVGDLADVLVRGCTNDEEAARTIFGYVIRSLRYERDDVWDPAPAVIERGSGSCSEYNYCFMALCRAAGIPARYTGGIVLRREAAEYDARVIEDAVFHRWSEVFVDGRGWIPVDCSRASGEVKRHGNPDNCYGRLPAGVLQCVRGDGLGGTPLGWDYLSNQKLPYEEDVDWSGKVGFWVSDIVPGALAARVSIVEKKLGLKQDRALFDELLEDSIEREILFLFRNLLKRSALPDLIDALHAARHPEAVYWSLLAEHRGMGEHPAGVDAEAAGGYGTLSGKELKDRIAEYYFKEDGGRDLFSFEYWWRKARPKTRWDDEKGVFVLTDTDINIY